MNKLHILIVDDSEMIRQYLRSILIEFDAEFTEAANGIQAYKLIYNNIYDLIFMDIEMPGKSGLDVIKRVRSELGYQYTPIIVMTGLQSDNLIKQAFEVGASDYIAKPLSPHEVISRSKIRLENRQMSRDLALASRAKSDFISRLAHELRDPLNAIRGLSDFIKMRSDDEKIHRSCNLINEASVYQNELISETSDLAKIEAGIIHLQKQVIRLNELIGEIEGLVKPMLAGTDLQLHFPDPARFPFRLMADKKRMIEILMNLISNAIKYNRPGGSIRVIIELMDDDHLKFGVRDTGIGIDVKDYDSLFLPFNRLDAEKSHIKGTGIGLTITKKLVELMKGEIQVESQPGKGSTFWVDLKDTYLLAEPE